MDSKKPWLSKTLWVNAIVAVSAMIYPPASEWVSAHPDVVVSVFAGINILLRLVTKDAIGLSE